MTLTARGCVRLLRLAAGALVLACQPEEPNYLYVQSVAVSPESSVTYVGGHLQVTATPLAPGGIPLDDRHINWYSSNPRVATVSRSGEVAAVGAGTASITAYCETKTAMTTVTILARPVADWAGVSDEWTTFQGNPRHTGFVPATADPLSFTRRWEVDLAHGTGLHPVVEGDGVLFATSTAYYAGQQLFAVDAATGATRWAHDFGVIQSLGPPAYGDNAVYVFTGGTNSSLWGLEANSGAPRVYVEGYEWLVSHAPVPWAQALYTASAFDGDIYAFSMQDGSLRWSSGDPTNYVLVPAVADGRVYAYRTYNEAKVAVSDAASGALLYEIADPGYLVGGWGGRSVPVLGGMGNLVVEQNDRLVAFDLIGRRVMWEKAGIAFREEPTIAGGVIYAHTPAEVQARRESDGSLLWTWTPPGGEEPRGTMVATRNLLFVTSGPRTVAIDLSAQAEVWSYPAAGNLALTRNGLLLIAQAGGTLTAIALK